MSKPALDALAEEGIVSYRSRAQQEGAQEKPYCYEPTTAGGHKACILPSASAATRLAFLHVDEVIAEYKKQPPGSKMAVTTCVRDGKSKEKKVQVKEFLDSYESARGKLVECEKAIVKGSPAMNEAIKKMTDELVNTCIEIEPSLTNSYGGFERWEDGDEVIPDLLAEGNDRPFLRRARNGCEPKPGKGDGAYRIIINTDVSWWGTPDMNASVMGALVVLLQTYGPVELWIQQGWMGSSSDDGVALFKLDFTGGFEPTQLAFWCGHEYKDAFYSRFVNRSLGRTGNGTSCYAELPCDLYMRGDWMSKAGVSGNTLTNSTPQERRAIMAKWILETVKVVAFDPEAEEVQ